MLEPSPGDHLQGPEAGQCPSHIGGPHKDCRLWDVQEGNTTQKQYMGCLQLSFKFGPNAPSPYVKKLPQSKASNV